MFPCGEEHMYVCSSACSFYMIFYYDFISPYLLPKSTISDSGGEEVQSLGEKNP